MTPDPRALTKFLSVQRSDRVPTLYWWSLPVSLGTAAELYADALRGARALVYPAAALGALRDAPGTRVLAGDAAFVDDPAALLRARDDGRVGPCTIAIFPPQVAAAADDLESRAAAMARDLERLPFTIAIRPEGHGRGRHRFCFRVPGKVIGAIERLGLDRTFGGNAGQVEMALLQGLALRPKQTARLQLVLQDGAARLVGSDAGGRRRVTLLESDRGYVGVYDELSLAEAVSERTREAWRRFPVGIVMFVGLPFFIAAFWIASLVRRGAAAAPER